MKKKRHIVLGLLLSILIFNGVAGDLIDINPKGKGSSRKPSWILGVGWNIVDDNGNPFKKLFSVRKAWNIRWYPTQLSAEILGEEGFAYGAILSYNVYKPGKVINGVEAAGSFPFLSIDGFVKYHLNAGLNIKKRYDPYIPIGFGYTMRTMGPYFSTATFNFGLGINIWMNSQIGFNLQSMAKFGMKSPFLHSGSNYLQHSIGLVYIIDNTLRKKHSMVKPRYKWVHDTRYVK